jgi:hypothetical protein
MGYFQEVPHNASEEGRVLPTNSFNLASLTSTMMKLSLRMWALGAAVGILLTLATAGPSGASFPHVANPKQIPTCTNALKSLKPLTSRGVESCLSMMGRSVVAERCAGGGKAYLISLHGWSGIPNSIAATYGLRVGHRAYELIAPAYGPRQLNRAICDDRG